MRFMIALSALCALCTGTAFAQIMLPPTQEERVGEYEVTIRVGSMKISASNQVWKLVPGEELHEFQLLRGDDQEELHTDRSFISYGEDNTFLVEVFTTHPRILGLNGSQRWVGFVEERDEHGKVLRSWPSFYQLIVDGSVTVFKTTHFLGDGSRIIWNRRYDNNDYFLPVFVEKETYPQPYDMEPATIVLYKRIP